MAYARPRKLLLRCLALAAAAQATNWGGLRNQGNTCYLNSLLQTLFHVPALRSDVLGRPAEPRGLMKRLRTAPRPARALADVFKRLAQNATAQTRGLTRALGVSGLPDSVAVASLYVWSSGREAEVLHWMPTRPRPRPCPDSSPDPTPRP